MRLIYTDEAGTSAPEPVRVVAAVIVQGDEEHRNLTREFQKVLDECVPASVRDGFVFHAADVFGGGKGIDRQQWSFPDRLEFIKRVLGLMPEHSIPVAMGCVFAGYHERILKHLDMPVPYPVYDHVVAFGSCLERADAFLRKYLKGAEDGVVIAEDAPERRRVLRATGLRHRDRPLALQSDHFRQNEFERALGVAPEAFTYRIDHIIDVPHFVTKDGAALLQLADASAFAFRRCLAKQKGGDELLEALLGRAQARAFIADEVWFSQTSSGLFNTESYWDEDQRNEAISRSLVFGFARAVAVARSKATDPKM